MRRAATTTVLLAALCGFAGVDATPSRTASLSFWPSRVDSELSYALHGEEIEIESKGEGGLLSTYLTSMSTDKFIANLHPAIRSIEVSWIPPSTNDSSTFSNVIAKMRGMFRSNAVGVHLQVQVDSARASEIESSDELERLAEATIRTFMEQSLPSFAKDLELYQGFLARSPCRLSNWRGQDLGPLFGSSNGSEIPEELCYASSFPFPSLSTAMAPAFCSRDACSQHSTLSRVEEAIWSTPNIHLMSAQLRGASLNVLNDNRAPKLDYTEAWMSPTKFHKGNRPDLHSKAYVAVVTSVKQDSQLHVNYAVLSASKGDSSTLTSSFHSLPSSIPGTMAVSVEGEGFHRRLALKLDVPDNGACAPESEESILLVVPLAHTLYADLDELRRLERFGHFQVHAFEKHIEIERPSPVSSQHVIAVQMKLPSTRQLNTEIPIHFRYQAPSTSEMYSPAVVIAPEALMYCWPHTLLSYDTPAMVSSEEDLFMKHLMEHFRSGGGGTFAAGWHSIGLTAPIGTWQVLTPVGYLPFQTLVSSVTFASTCIAAAILVWVAAQRKQSVESDQHKKSD